MKLNLRIFMFTYPFLTSRMKFIQKQKAPELFQNWDEKIAFTLKNCFVSLMVSIGIIGIFFRGKIPNVPERPILSHHSI